MKYYGRGDVLSGTCFRKKKGRPGSGGGYGQNKTHHEAIMAEAGVHGVHCNMQSTF